LCVCTDLTYTAVNFTRIVKPEIINSYMVGTFQCLAYSSLSFCKNNKFKTVSLYSFDSQHNFSSHRFIFGAVDLDLARYLGVCVICLGHIQKWRKEGLATLMWETLMFWRSLVTKHHLLKISSFVFYTFERTWGWVNDGHITVTLKVSRLIHFLTWFSCSETSALFQ